MSTPENGLSLIRTIAIGVLALLMVIAASSTGGAGKSAIYNAPATTKYSLDASQSKFIAHAFAGGLFWFKGHDHYVAAKDFSGDVEITTESLTPASLRLVVKSGSLVETGAVFTEPQKQIINKELREIVLQPEQYPEIIFQSTGVTGKPAANGRYDVKITGDLTLHGVTRRIVVPAQVTLSGNDMRAVGEFSIDRGDYKVKATSAFHGLVRVRDEVKFNFDVVGHRQ
jgi:polyisoprenoid-binding protein YceI